MTSVRRMPLTQGAKLNRIFEFFHGPDEAELTNEAVATIVGQRLGRTIDPTLLAQVRAGKRELNDTPLARELAGLAGIEYLDFLISNSPEALMLERQLRFWILWRDKGIQGAATRLHGCTIDQIEALIQELEAIEPQPHAGRPQR